ncbi:hypothetical protein [Siminovitchia fortis]|uniref:hypothetical protein n=1 Tax=Siminovitchia fortis TaxID=254758 RepID=UPI0011AAB8C0|nr:hypothetical protein [Siminovitchia fortis]
MDLIKAQMKTLPADGLYLLYLDTVNRIGSHVTGSKPNVHYVRRQEAILSLIQDELNTRNQQKGEM